MIAGDCANGIENTATITSDADTNDQNNSSDDSIEVLCPDLELEKSGSDPVSAGDDVSFTLTVTNHGEGDAKNVVLTDNLPDDGLSIWTLGGIVPIGAADCGIVADVLTCSVDLLAAGASFSVTVKRRPTPMPARASRTMHRSWRRQRAGERPVPERGRVHDHRELP